MKFIAANPQVVIGVQVQGVCGRVQILSPREGLELSKTSRLTLLGLFTRVLDLDLDLDDCAGRSGCLSIAERHLQTGRSEG